MAEIDATRGDVQGALAALDRALLADGESASVRDLRTALLRRAVVSTRHGPCNRDALARDPLDAWAANERRLLDGETGSEATDATGWACRAPVPPSTWPTTTPAPDLLEEAIEVLAGPFAPGRDPGTLPMVGYTLGWLHERARDTAAAARATGVRQEPAGRPRLPGPDR